jgi:type II secretory pathway predicted ATPase ExeA
MYRTYYGLESNPFTKESGVSPFLFKDYEFIQSRFKYLLETRGLGVFIGHPGTGKTYAIRQYIDNCTDKRYKFYYVCSTSLTVIEFYRALCHAFRIVPSHRKVEMAKSIKDEITKLFKDNKFIPILVIDEAQYLPKGVVEDLSILLNYEYDSRNYLTIALIGNEGLGYLLNQYQYESIKQRIVINYQTNGITTEQFQEYVKLSLEKVGCYKEIFEPSVILGIYNNSRGSIRVANKYLTTCLLAGYGEKSNIINNDILKMVHDELLTIE